MTEDRFGGLPESLRAQIFSGMHENGDVTVKIQMRLSPKDAAGLRAKHLVDIPAEPGGTDVSGDWGLEPAVIGEIVQMLTQVPLDEFQVGEISISCGGSAAGIPPRQ